MSLHETLVDCINRACADVFAMMMGVPLPPGEISAETSPPDAIDGVVSLIGMAGKWTGTGSLGCSAALACRICSLLLATEVQSVDEEVLDAVAELTNMIVGSVKTDLERELGPLGLSIPTVVYGRNFKTRSAGPTEWTTLRFVFDGEPLVVRVSLAPTERKAHARLHGLPHSCDFELTATGE